MISDSFLLAGFMIVYVVCLYTWTVALSGCDTD